MLVQVVVPAIALVTGVQAVHVAVAGVITPLAQVGWAVRKNPSSQVISHELPCAILLAEHRDPNCPLVGALKSVVEHACACAWTADGGETCEEAGIGILNDSFQSSPVVLLP